MRKKANKIPHIRPHTPLSTLLLAPLYPLVGTPPAQNIPRLRQTLDSRHPPMRSHVPICRCPARLNHDARLGMLTARPGRQFWNCATAILEAGGGHYDSRFLPHPLRARRPFAIHFVTEPGGVQGGDGIKRFLDLTLEAPSSVLLASRTSRQSELTGGSSNVNIRNVDLGGFGAIPRFICRRLTLPHQDSLWSFRYESGGASRCWLARTFID